MAVWRVSPTKKSGSFSVSESANALAASEAMSAMAADFMCSLARVRGLSAGGNLEVALGAERC